MAYSHDEKRGFVTAVFRSSWEQDPKPFQLDAVIAALDRKHVMVTAPPGAGKTRIWEVLALFSKDRVTIVVNPLLALGEDMVGHYVQCWNAFLNLDQVRRLRHLGFKAIHLHADNFAQFSASVGDGEYDFVLLVRNA